MAGRISMVKERISPKKAAEYLKLNNCNRPLSKSKWQEYADIMTCGRWQLNGDTIRFSSDGYLIDGQHRLKACEYTGRAFETYVLRGLPSEAFDTFDQGKKRSLGDVFARQRYKYANQLAAAVRCTVWYERGWVKNTVRVDEGNDALEANPKLHDACRLAVHLYNVGDRLMAPGLLAFLIHECGRSDWERSTEFWTAVSDGVGLTKTSPAYLLRRRLLQNEKSTATKLRNDTLTALSIKAWNFHVSGTKCGTLKWAVDEKFPMVQH